MRRKIKNKAVCGVATNDSEYVVLQQQKKNGKSITIWVCPYYRRWSDMTKRCYSKRVKDKQPTYKEVVCCDEWLLFSNFKSWMEKQDWEGNYLDKDLLIYNNKVYSPETCCFISRKLNNFMTKHDAKRGNWPLGVSWKKNNLKFDAKIQGADGGSLFLGLFEDERTAHRAWQKEKINQATYILNISNDTKIRIGIQRIIDKIQNDLDLHEETIDF